MRSALCWQVELGLGSHRPARLGGRGRRSRWLSWGSRWLGRRGGNGGRRRWFIHAEDDGLRQRRILSQWVSVIPFRRLAVPVDAEHSDSRRWVRQLELQRVTWALRAINGGAHMIPAQLRQVRSIQKPTRADP